MIFPAAVASHAVALASASFRSLVFSWLRLRGAVFRYLVFVSLALLLLLPLLLPSSVHLMVAVVLRVLFVLFLLPYLV